MTIKKPFFLPSLLFLLLLSSIGVAKEQLSSESQSVRKQWWLVGGQVTSINQGHPAVPGSPSNPTISFGPEASFGWSVTTSLFGAVSPWKGGVLMCEPEYANGRGMPNASGLAGYPNGDIIRVPQLGKTPYIAQAFYHQDFSFTDDSIKESSEFEGRFLPPGVHDLSGTISASRLELTIGKFAVNDFFDVSGLASDPRHHFMNWALMDQGAWDYAADTRGYTYGIVMAVEQKRFAIRGSVALMPTVANGITLDWNIRHSRSEMIEGELKYHFFEKPGSVKALCFVNHAHMGNYDTAVASAPVGTPPDITSVERTGAIKFGGGLLVDQQLNTTINAFLRVGANDGQTETFAFTEIDRSISFGADTRGEMWKRPKDHLALGVAFNGLSNAHARYLAAGGHGFQLGDGKLQNAWETVAELYYLVPITKYVEITADIQGVFNLGMNAARGPTEVFGLRLHAHF